VTEKYCFIDYSVGYFFGSSAVRFSAGSVTVLQWNKYVKFKTVMLINDYYCMTTPNLIMAVEE